VEGSCLISVGCWDDCAGSRHLEDFMAFVKTVFCCLVGCCPENKKGPIKSAKTIELFIYRSALSL